MKASRALRTIRFFNPILNVINQSCDKSLLEIRQQLVLHKCIIYGRINLIMSITSHLETFTKKWLNSNRRFMQSSLNHEMNFIKKNICGVFYAMHLELLFWNVYILLDIFRGFLHFFCILDANHSLINPKNIRKIQKLSDFCCCWKS